MPKTEGAMSECLTQACSVVMTNSRYQYKESSKGYFSCPEIIFGQEAIENKV
jgi:hypothetical protein